MDKLKQWVALTVVAVLAVLAAGWFLAVSPKRASAAQLRTQTAATRASTAQLSTQLSVLKAQAVQLPEKQAALAEAEKKIPGDADLPDLLRSLSATAASSGVVLTGITPAAAVPVVSTTAPTVAASPSAGAMPTGGAAAARAAVATAAGAGGAGTLSAMPVSLGLVGSYFKIQEFLAALEDMPRAVRVTGLTLLPGSSPTATGGTAPAAPSLDDSLSATVTAQVYVAVGRTPLAPVSVPGASTVPTPAPAH